MLPVGIQSLGEIRRMDCHYVDKTAHVLRLVRGGKYYFPSRPRRFGKSLPVDTPKELFEGNGQLFRGPAIHGGWDWDRSRGHAAAPRTVYPLHAPRLEWPRRDRCGGMDRTIYGFVFRHSLRQQMLLLVLTVASFPVLYSSLELPKIIINEAIQGTEFPKEVLGLEFDQIPFLVAASLTFLGLVLLNGAFKFAHQHLQGPARRAASAASALRTLFARAAFPAFRVQADESGRDHPDDHPGG